MQKVDVRKLVSRPKGSRALLPPVEGTLRAEREYLKALRSVLTGAAQIAREEIVPMALAEIRMQRDGLTRDIDTATFIRFASRLATLVYAAEEMVARILRLETDRHTEKFAATAKRALGIDLAAVIRREDIGGYFENALARNVGLIRGLADDVSQRVQQAVSTAVINGQSATTLRKTLTEQFGIADRRAQLIARDQIAKTNSDLNRIRQEQVGVKSYEWLTSADERVRPLHRALDGKVYKWGEATGAEGGLPPGQPVRCRCVARGIVEF